MAHQPIQLYIITGFLGSGKTTFLKNLLHYHDREKTGVIMNEFGEISIDGQILRDTAGEIVEINNGSIFCSCLQGSFLQSLIDFSQFPIRALFVECSGLSDPSNLRQLLEVANKKSGSKYQYCGNICLVDSQYFPKLVSTLPVLEKQVKYSHLIVLNKTDLISEEDQESLAQHLKEINDRAMIVPTSHSQVPPGLLEPGILSEDMVLDSGETCNTPESRLKTITLQADGLHQKESLIQFLKILQENVFRAKGFFHLKEGLHQVDMVGEQLNIKPSSAAIDSTMLVMITAGDDPFFVDQIRSHWDEHFSVPMKLSES